MHRLVERLLRNPAIRQATRGASDWIDLQWSLTVAGLRDVAPQARGRLLDVGCGTKPYQAIFRPYVEEYIGLEHEATFGATSAAGMSVGPDVFYDGQRIPFEDRSFDTVLSIQVLEHTPRPQELVDEMARVLRQDGLLILSAPFCFRLHEQPHDYFRYSPHGLREICSRAGLEITSVQAQGSLWSVLGNKLNSFLGLQIAGFDGLAQSLGKLNFEAQHSRPSRPVVWPIVLPTMVWVSAAARLLDRWLPDPTEALSYLVLAKHRPGSKP